MNIIKKFIFYVIVINTSLNASIYDSILTNFNKFNFLPEVHLKDAPLPICIGTISILCGTYFGYYRAKKAYDYNQILEHWSDIKDRIEGKHQKIQDVLKNPTKIPEIINNYPKYLQGRHTIFSKTSQAYFGSPHGCLELIPGTPSSYMDRKPHLPND